MPKLEAAGMLDYPFIITQMKQKDDLIKKWYNPTTESYEIPLPGYTLVLKCVDILDDKSTNAENMPENAHAVIIDRPEEENRPNQLGSLSSSAEKVSNLQTATEIFKARSQLLRAA